MWETSGKVSVREWTVGMNQTESQTVLDLFETPLTDWSNSLLITDSQQKTWVQKYCKENDLRVIIIIDRQWFIGDILVIKALTTAEAICTCKNDVRPTTRMVMWCYKCAFIQQSNKQNNTIE